MRINCQGMIFTMLIVLLKFWQQISYYFGKDNFPLDMTKSVRSVPILSTYLANFIVPSTWHDAPITIKHKHITSTPWYLTYSQFVAVPIQVFNPFLHPGTFPVGAFLYEAKQNDLLFIFVIDTRYLNKMWFITKTFQKYKPIFNNSSWYELS